jgi:TonB family protein
VYWDRRSPVFDKATKATLYITDGERKNQLNLDRDDLKAGEVSYRPRSTEVTFHLQVVGPGYSTDDSIRVVGGPGVPDPSGRRIEKRADSTPPPPKNPQGTATRTDTRADLDVYHPPSPFTPIPKPMMATPLPPAAAPSLPAPHPPERSPEPDVPVTVEPAGQSAVGKMIGHIPLLRRLKKQPQPVVPPVPVHEVRPMITARERHALTHSFPVDIRVFVSETGKVSNVELIGNGARQPELARRAIAAARRWEFTPARSGPDRVPGEVILHFRFLMEELADSSH